MENKNNILSVITLFGVLCGLIIFVIIGAGVIHLHHSVMAERARTARNIVDMAFGVANHYQQLQEKGLLSEQEAKVKARDAIREMRHSDDGYMLAFRMDGICEVHGATPANEGKQRIDLQTARGLYVVREFVKVAKKGEGYVYYDYPRPGHPEQSLSKIAYIRYYAPWDWMIATGVYVDDVNSTFWQMFAEWGQFILGPFIVLVLLTITMAYWIKKPFLYMERAKDMAEAASRAKTSFISNVSHEIRTPLTSMLGSLGIINGTMADKLPEQVQKLLVMAHKNAERLLFLVNDLLDFAKMDAGKFVLESQPFSVCASIGKVTEIMLIRAREKGLELLVRYQTPVPDKIMGDAVRFEQVLLNLLSNAIKFTDSGSINIFIRKIERGDEPPMLHVEVTDTGIGISEDKLEYIFEKFTQEDESTTRKYGGTGLGLTISSDIVKMMGGSLKVNSKIGQGSTFFFDIPLIPVP